jgi:nitrogen fixation protein FixH
MEHQNIALTLAVGVLVSASFFFIFYKGLKRPGKLSALLAILAVQGIYIPLAIMHWPGLDVFAIHFGFYTMTAVVLGIVITNRDERGGRFHWAVGVLLGFFLILAMVDATIITLATTGASADFVKRFLPEPRRESAQNVTSSFPGTVSNNFQKQYAEYNNYLSQLRIQSERGWRFGEGWLTKPYVNQPSVFRIRVEDRNAQPITGAAVQLSFLRPSKKELDQKFVLLESVPGTYELPVSLPAPGAWDMVLVVTRGDEFHEAKSDTWIEEVR